MKKLNKWNCALAAGAGLALGTLTAPAALADEPPAPWIKMTATSGCTFFMYDYDDPSGTWLKEAPWTWTGGCANGLASGSGDLTTARRDSGGGAYTTGYRGTLKGGHMDGRVEEIYNGKMLADYYWQTFEMGCGSAAHYVYCQPATLTQAAAVPPPVTKQASQRPAPVAASTRIGSDAAAILAALGVEDEDRVFAMLAELIQTGRIDLAREAELQLARRFPNSPLITIASQLLAAQASAPGTSGGMANVPYNDQTLRSAVEARYGASKNVSTGSTPAYEFRVPSSIGDLPLVAEVSANGNYVWISARLTTGTISPHTAQLALQRVVSLQPTMMWEREGLRLGQALRNRGLTDADVLAAVETVANNVVQTADLWQQ